MPAEGTRKRGATWYAYWSEPDADTGRPRRVERRAVDEGQPNSEQGAMRARRAALKRLDDGLTPSGRTVAQLVTRYIEQRPNLKPATRHLYRQTDRLHIAPYLGDTPARDLSPGDVRGWHVTLTRAKYAAGTIRLAHALLSASLDMERRDERLGRNVAALVRPPSIPATREPTAWDEAEIVRFVAVASTDAQDGVLWTLLLLSGLRIGEALALTWANLDLERGSLSVRQTRTSDEHGRAAVGPPKSAAGKRDMTLPPDAVALLRAHRDRAAFAGRLTPAALVFPISPDAVRERLRAFCRLHGFGANVRPHDLRHVHISWLTAARMDPLAIIARVGHSDLSMLKTYAHVAPASAATLGGAIADRLDAARAALVAADDGSGTGSGSP